MPPPLTPFAIVSQLMPVQQARKSVLVAVTRGLELEAALAPPDAMAVTFQDVRHFTPATRRLYTELAGRGVPVTVHARGIQSWLAPGLTGISLAEEHPMVDEWNLVMLSEDHPVAFTATDCGDVGVDDSDRTFLFSVTRDAAVARALAEGLDLAATVSGSRQAPEIGAAEAGPLPAGFPSAPPTR